MTTPRFKIPTDFLLKHALELLKTDRATLEQRIHQHYGLRYALLATTVKIDYPTQHNGVAEHSTDHIWETPEWLVKTTRYNKIKSVERKVCKPRVVKPAITIKKRRKIEQ